ncbi:UCH-domain-containing protein [Phellopilus nigrolimitatus]|nr:UCH-domain-containing protein [Phellopilus nigrolimitatus]
MDSLPSPAISVENSPRTSPSTLVTLGRKRARSSASSDASSSKRAMSEDPSFGSATEPPQSIASPSPQIAADGIDTYMRGQGEQGMEQSSSDVFGQSSSTGLLQESQLRTIEIFGPPRKMERSEHVLSQSQPANLSSVEKYQLIKALQKVPMVAGQTWYVISRSWFRKWEKACTGEVDKEGAILESQLGPVDNSSFFNKDGKFDGSRGMIEGVDVEFVPEQAWNSFVAWYGKPLQVIARKVITRGINKEASLELRPPVLQVLRLISSISVEKKELPSKYVTVSSQATLADLYRNLLGALELSLEQDFRVWKVENLDVDGTHYPCGKLLKDGGQLLPSKNDTEKMLKTVDDCLIQSDDALVVEVFENGAWLVNESAVPSNDLTVVPDEPAGPIFASGSDFFSQMNSSSSKSSAKASTLKPTASTSSSLTSSYGKGKTDKKGIIPGTIGLVNMGNTCFMNSALQCLAHTEELVEYFLTGVFSDELNPDNPLGMQGAIAEAFGSLLNRIWLPQASGAYAPREFKMQLQRFAPQFSGYQQHDSQELVTFLLDGLHEDLNRVLKKPYVEKLDWEGGGDKELAMLAKESWDGYMKRNDSVIVDLFQGQYRSTLVCPECQKISITFDPFMQLTLPLPVQKKWTHKIFYVPWDPNKAHVKVPIEVNRNASFREVRQLLGRWMKVEPDNLLTMETFNNRFYKDLDDTVLVGDMGDTDVVVCFELPCHAQQSRTWKPDADPIKNPVIVPVHLCKEIPSSRNNFQRPSNGFAHPFIVVLDNDQVRDRRKIYAAVVERLQRWTQQLRDLYQWETDAGMEEVKFLEPRGTTSVTEIKENGDVVTVQEAALPEEGDIVDEKSLVLEEEEPFEIISGNEVLKRVGPKADLFEVHIQSGHEKLGAGSSWSSNAQKWERWETREKANCENPPLLFEGDALYCEWQENFRQYFFGDEPKYELARWGEQQWDEFIHPDYQESQLAALARNKKDITLQDCLEEFTREEQLGEDDLWYCPQCKKHQQATKKIDLWSVPDVLVVHLKRFSNSRVLRDKIDVFVDFPIENLNLETFCVEHEVAKRLAQQGQDIKALGLSDVEEPLVYDLYAVDEHSGGLGGGHYGAYAKHHGVDKWYHFEDSYVSPAQASDAVNASAYLLFYKRRTSRPIGGKTYEKIEAARQKFIAAEDELAADAQLPTPPDDVERTQKDHVQKDLLEVIYKAQQPDPEKDRWRSFGPGPSVGLSPSPPALDDNEIEFSSENENEPPPFEEAHFDRLVGSGIDLDQGDPLALATQRFDFPDPASMITSPASSNAADAGDATDMGDMDFTDMLDGTPQGTEGWQSDDESKRRSPVASVPVEESTLLDIDL